MKVNTISQFDHEVMVRMCMCICACFVSCDGCTPCGRDGGRGGGRGVACSQRRQHQLLTKTHMMPLSVQLRYELQLG